jgi:hypothetical protein
LLAKVQIVFSWITNSHSVSSGSGWVVRGRGGTYEFCHEPSGFIKLR